MPIRSSLLRGAALIAALVVTACGDEDSAEPASSTEIELRIGAGKLSMNAGESVEVHASVATSGARLYTLKFTSRNAKVASVDGDGMIKAVAAGTTTIDLVATLLDTGATAKASVEVVVAGGAVLAPKPAQPTYPGLPVDPKYLMKRLVGSSAFQVTQSSQFPSVSDGTGQFRTGCSAAFMDWIDPIMAPGKPGASHLHTFFGNTSVTANSNMGTLAAQGNSTCRAGTADRSSRWVPTMLDAKNVPLVPVESSFYYKTGYALPKEKIGALPKGLRMIAGDAKRSTPTGESYEWNAYYVCDGEGEKSAGVKKCSGELWQVVVFPQCWDGVNLDSADHKSHMANPVGGACPASHPKAIPDITFNVRYVVPSGVDSSKWRLSSDTYLLSNPSALGGYSGHADWVNGWDEAVQKTWIDKCVRAGKDCQAHMLGDGRITGESATK